MKNVIIWGAGQGGRMVYNMLHSEMRVLAFVDNNTSLHGSKIYGIPVVDTAELPKIRPDYIFISILNNEACSLVKEQIVKTETDAIIICIAEFRKQFDIRLAVLRLISNEINRSHIKGSVAELGVYRGEFAAEISRLFPDRKIYLFDTFEGFDEGDLEIEKENNYFGNLNLKFSNTGIDIVKERLAYPGQALFRKGYFPETGIGLNEEFALVSLDADLYKPTYEGLKFFYPRMSRGGYIILHDYNNSQFRGAGAAVSQFCRENGIYVVPICDLHGSAVIVKP